MIVAAICLTALVIAWLGRGAHDGRLRLAAQRMQLEAGAHEAEDVAALAGRVTALEVKSADHEKAIEKLNTAIAFKGSKR